MTVEITLPHRPPHVCDLPSTEGLPLDSMAVCKELVWLHPWSTQKRECGKTYFLSKRFWSKRPFWRREWY